jgi:antitoxin protein of toxin-antitoxin system
MGIADRLNELKSKAVDATVEHSDKIQEAVEKVASTANERTGGKYHERIEQAGAEAGSLLDSLKAAPGDVPPAAPQAGDASPADAPGGAPSGQGPAAARPQNTAQ